MLFIREWFFSQDLVENERKLRVKLKLFLEEWSQVVQDALDIYLLHIDGPSSFCAIRKSECL